MTARFLRVGNHLINLEVIQQVELRKDGSAVVAVPGPRKSLQRIQVPKPMGQELWDFFNENLVVIDFNAEAQEADPVEKKAKTKPKAPPNEEARQIRQEARGENRSAGIGARLPPSPRTLKPPSPALAAVQLCLLVALTEKARPSAFSR
ncbi:MAG: hypothetical protein U5J83_07580 [Bryobacterales bacterium]|nr:hypothetical protein [Bryobacterales bacterium]